MENQVTKLTSESILNDRTEKAFRYVEAYNQMDLVNITIDFDDSMDIVNF